MGCLLSLEAEDDDGAGETKEYSWDKREDVNTEDLTIKGLRNGSAFRESGRIKGNQVLIEDCHGSDIYIFDHSAVVTVDDCVDCTIYIGPIKGSVFLRDSKNCRFIIACQQFRTRDCENIDVLLSCNTLPIIEATQGIRFGCYRSSHYLLAGQFAAAGLPVYNNYWYKIHDFTKSTDGSNFSFFQDQPAWLAGFFDRRPDEVKDLEIELDLADAVVPVTTGPDSRVEGEGACLVVAFSQKSAKKLLQTMQRASAVKAEASFKIIRAAELVLAQGDAAQIFAGDECDKYVTAAGANAVVGVEISGAGYMSLIHAATSSLGDTPLFVSEAKPALSAFFAHTESKLRI